MLLLAEITLLARLLILIAAGWLVLKLFRRRGEHRCGFLRILGITAVVAGIALFLARSNHAVRVEPVPVDVGVVVEADHPFDVHTTDYATDPIVVSPDSWVFITLGSALVILGVLLFSRGGTRPVAIKAVTVLGIGAILYAVVTFFGHPPRHSRHSTRMVSVERHRDASDASRHVTRHGESASASSKRSWHAKRPTLRRDPPQDSAVRQIVLPPRAGEIPVSDELAHDASQPEVPPVAEQTAASEAVSAAQPSPAEAASDAAEPDDEASPDEADTSAPTVGTAKEDAPNKSDHDEPASDAAEQPAKVDAAESVAVEVPQPVAAVEAAAVEAEPSAEVIVPSDGPRPEWVDAEAGLIGNGVYATPVCSGVFASVAECQRELERAMKRTTDLYIDEYLGEGTSPIVDVSRTYLNGRIKKAEYAETVQSESVGQMYQMHARLEFDNGVRNDFHRRLHDVEVVHRLWYTGGGAVLVLALLATVYGYLKLDLRTGGAHKGALQLAATLVALIAAAGVPLVRWAVPF